MDVEDYCHQVLLLSAEAAEEVMNQGIYHMHRIQRPFVPEQVDLPMLREFWTKRFELEKEGIKADIAKEDIKPLKKDGDARKTLGDLDKLLMNKLGAGGTPLAYATRKEVALPENVPGEGDPGLGLPTLQEEFDSQDQA